jgi:VWFA-related protein
MAASQDQVPTFRTGVSAVLVDVVVLDSSGGPVEGLERSDFDVLEDGVKQEIATFDVTDWTSYVAARTGDGPQAASVNTYPRRFVFIVNRVGAQFEWLTRAKRALATFIVESMAEGDEAMVVDVAHSTKIVQQFQAAKEETLQAVRKLSQMQIDYPMGPDRAAGFFYRDLESLADSLAQVPGRKVIILLSNELRTFVPPGSRETNQSFALKAATDALNQANASVYTIDIRGPESVGMDTYGGLSPLATETGGRFYRNNVTFEPTLRRIGKENQRYYLLSYVSTNSEADGSYRKIDVRVNRPGVEVIARHGYYARAPESTSAPETAPGDAVDVAAPPPDLPLAVELTTYLLPTGTGTVRVPVSVAFPAGLLEERGGAALRASLTVTGADGVVAGSFDDAVSLARFFLMRTLELAPGSYLAEVRLASEGRELYTTSSAFDVPAGFGERFGLSSIVPVVSPESASRVGSDLPILPTVTVKRGSNLHVLFQVFRGPSSERAERARVRYRILNDDGAEVWAGALEGEIALSDRPDGTPVLLSLPTASLAFGRHRVEVRVEDPSRGRAAASDVEFRVR